MCVLIVSSSKPVYHKIHRASVLKFDLVVYMCVKCKLIQLDFITIPLATIRSLPRPP